MLIASVVDPIVCGGNSHCPPNRGKTVEVACRQRGAATG